jgi:hypothetical protein
MKVLTEDMIKSLREISKSVEALLKDISDQKESLGNWTVNGQMPEAGAQPGNPVKPKPPEGDEAEAGDQDPAGP